MQVLQEILVGLAVTLGFVATIAVIGFLVWASRTSGSFPVLLKRHFRPTPLSRLSITERKFPAHIRADLQRAMPQLLDGVAIRVFSGVNYETHGFGGADFSSLLDGSAKPAPPQYEQIDISEEEPVRALQSGAWLLEREGARFALLYAPVSDIGQCGMICRSRFQLATVDNEQGARLARDFFRRLESEVLNARSYRGKVLSLERDESYTGQASGVKVHRGISVPDDVLQNIVSRTDKVSDSFIKELMRRSAQFHLERNGSSTLSIADVENALDEMLFSGGSLNLMLLGAEQRIGEQEGAPQD